MKADPETIQAKVPWGSGPVGTRVVALFWLAMAFGAAATPLGSRREVLTLVGLGLIWGLIAWQFDRWWGRRSAVRLVDTEDPLREWLRYAPTLTLDVGAILVVFALSSDSAVFVFSLLAVQEALVVPGWAKRRAARRTVKVQAIELEARP